MVLDSNTTQAIFSSVVGSRPERLEVFKMPVFHVNSTSHEMSSYCRQLVESH